MSCSLRFLLPAMILAVPVTALRGTAKEGGEIFAKRCEICRGKNSWY